MWKQSSASCCIPLRSHNRIFCCWKWVTNLLRSTEEFIAEEVRAKEISIGDAAAAGDLVKDWTVESVEMRIGVRVWA
jgi:hypothetical protein